MLIAEQIQEILSCNLKPASLRVAFAIALFPNDPARAQQWLSSFPKGPHSEN